MPWCAIGPYERHSTYVDDRDVHLMDKYPWACYQRYVTASLWNGGNRKTLLLHREIMMPPSHMVIDHIDGDPMNNSRHNLRVCLQEDNCRNITPGVGAYWNDECQKWQARIKHNGKLLHLGLFDTYEEAYATYVAKAIVLRGEFAHASLGG